MIDGLSISISEFEKDSGEPKPALTTSYSPCEPKTALLGGLSPQEPKLALSPAVSPRSKYSLFNLKWFSKFDKDEKISSITKKSLYVETSAFSIKESTLEAASPKVPARLRIQEKNLIHLISTQTVFNPSDSSLNGYLIDIHAKNSLIDYIQQKKYLTSTEKLEEEGEDPWDEIQKIKNPALIEQLVDLYYLCQFKKKKAMSDSFDPHKILAFGIQLAYFAASVKGDNSLYVNDAVQLLGQLIFLVDKDLPAAVRSVEIPIYKNALKSIKSSFIEWIKKIFHTIQHLFIAHQKTQLQDPEIAVHSLIPVEIAKTLLNENGTINTGIIDSLITIFIPKEKERFNYDVNLAHSLSLLQSSTSLRKKFEKIMLPISKTIASNDVIRATLGLLPEKEITLLDTRLTVLTAILSHLRQGADRSCFAVSLAIELLSDHVEYCINDFISILERGKLVKKIKEVLKEIPFILRISDMDLQKPISFDSEGMLIGRGQSLSGLWEAPGIQAVCRTLNIKNPEKTIKDLIKEFPKYRLDSVHSMDIKALILKICENAHRPETISVDQLYMQACFTFSSQTSQPLLKVWENALANLAEVEEGSMIKSVILEKTLDAIQYKLGEQGIPSFLALKNYLLLIQKSLTERIQLQYDPQIFSETSDSLQREKGGFVLYDQEVRIDTKNKFCFFIKEILMTNSKKMISDIISADDKKNFDRAIEILLRFIDSFDFIGYLLVRYQPSNKSFIQQILQNQRPATFGGLRFTPWITQVGNDSRALLKIYFESNKTLPSEQFTPSNATESLTKIIQICKAMPFNEKQIFLKNPHKLTPFRILGVHSFAFMAGNPSLSKAWQNEFLTPLWIEKFVKQPGVEVSRHLVDQRMKEAILYHFEKNILYQLISKEKVKLCMEQIQKFPEKKTVKEIRNWLVSLTTSMADKTSQIPRLIRHIDTLLWQSLDDSQKLKLQSSAIHFADTNWSLGFQDIHLCFVVNPGNETIELWEASPNGHYMKALDQGFWFENHHVWEFLNTAHFVKSDTLLRDDIKTR